MKTYRLRREQVVSQPLAKVFDFFADASNLEAITPPWLNFHILTPGKIEMQLGTFIQYALRVRGISMNWMTAITVWRPPYEFVDVQLRGPYTLWHHRHTFESLGEQTRMIDEVDYALPLGALGRLAQRLLVQHDLERIFRYRAERIEQILASHNAGKQQTSF